ncbi:MAG: GGDEF domain-containing protein [Betaproteobacteria bacterium]|nr:GGDEF domain-containing protein [Betaproteobacteria bacterium]
MFRLLRYFSLASFIAIVLATAALTAIYERQAVRDLVDAQEQHHVVLTRVAANFLWPQFSAFVRSSAALDNNALQSHPEIARLHRAVLQELAGTRVLKIKIYDLAGRTVFSTEARQIGEDKSKNAGFVAARDGKPASELTHRNQFSAFEQTVENIDVVSSYIPIYGRNSSAVEAVFEIYSDTSSLLRRMHETRNTVIIQVTSVLLGLYLVLFFIVKHADSVIKRQELQRQTDEESLRDARSAIVRSEEFHRALIEHSSEAVVLLGADFTVRYATFTVARILGRPEASIMGSPLVDCACEPYRALVEGWLTMVVSQPEAVLPIEFEGDHAAKGRRYFEATATNLLNHPGVQGIVVNIRDVTERKHAEMQVRRLALYDGLTGLAKRDFFAEQIRMAIAHARRYNELLAVMFLDLDYFKRVNDTLGHDAGDTLLKEVAARLRQILREGDTIGRYVVQQVEDHIARLGGDEFTILLNRLRQPEDAALVARRILDAVSRPYTLRGRKMTVTVSIGIAIFPRDGANLEELLKGADAAMYEAKAHGKNTFRPASEI